MSGASFARLGIIAAPHASYRAHSGGAKGAPLILVVPFDLEPFEAIRADSMSLAVQDLDGNAPFVSLALKPAVGTPTYLALTAEDLRSMGNALMSAAEQLETGAFGQ
jgi:hypothetical protein